MSEGERATRPFQTGTALAPWTPDGLRQQAREQQTLENVLHIVHGDFGRTWDSFDADEQRRVMDAARQVPPQGSFGAAVHRAVLAIDADRHMNAFAALRQEQTFVLDDRMFTSHPITGTTSYGGYTVNGPHYMEDGSPRYYLEQQLLWACAQHAANAMVGGPLLSITDLAQYEAEKTWRETIQNQIAAHVTGADVSIQSIRDDLLHNGIATHCFEPVMLYDDQDNPVLDRERLRYLDTRDTDRLLLQCISRNQGDPPHFVTFHRERDHWILWDRRQDAPEVGVSPSAYLLRTGAANFAAIWPTHEAQARIAEERTSIAENMVARGAEIDTVRGALLNKGIATHCFVPVLLIDEQKTPVQDVRQIQFLDRAPTDRMFLQRDTYFNDNTVSSHYVAFHHLPEELARLLLPDRPKEDWWVCLDSLHDVPQIGVSPSAYLSREAVGNFTAVWPQKRLVAVGAAALAMDARRGLENKVDAAALAGKLGITVADLPSVIPEWENDALHVWRLSSALTDAQRVAKLEPVPIASEDGPVNKLGGNEGRQLYEDLLRYQAAHLRGPVASAPAPASAASPGGRQPGLQAAQPAQFAQAAPAAQQSGLPAHAPEQSKDNQSVRQDNLPCHYADAREINNHWYHRKNKFQPVLDDCVQNGHKISGTRLLEQLAMRINEADARKLGKPVKELEKLTFEFTVAPFEGTKSWRWWRTINAMGTLYIDLAPEPNDETQRQDLVSDIKRKTKSAQTKRKQSGQGGNFTRDIAAAYYDTHKNEFEPLVNACIRLKGADVDGAIVLQRLHTICLAEENNGGGGSEVDGSDGLVLAFSVAPYEGMNPVHVWRGLDADETPYFRIAPIKDDTTAHEAVLNGILADLRQSILLGPQQPAVAYDAKIAEAYSWPLHQRYLGGWLDSINANIAERITGGELLERLHQLCTTESAHSRGTVMENTDELVHGFTVTLFKGLAPKRVLRGLDRCGWPTFRDASDADGPGGPKFLRTMLNDMMRSALRRPQQPALDAYVSTIISNHNRRQHKADFEPLRKSYSQAVGEEVTNVKLMQLINELCEAQFRKLGGKTVRGTRNRVFRYAVQLHPSMDVVHVLRGIDQKGIPHFRLAPDPADTAKWQNTLGYLLRHL